MTEPNRAQWKARGSEPDQQARVPPTACVMHAPAACRAAAIIAGSTLPITVGGGIMMLTATGFLAVIAAPGYGVAGRSGRRPTLRRTWTSGSTT